ncbi:MAG: DUF3667 domain-containing protein [Pyrinomonadaceae bacterium]
MASCKNCGSEFEGKYCNNCGQKLYTDHDRSLKHLFEELFHFFTHFEGSFFTSIRTIYTKPGTLTADYCGGSRKKYYKPISLYLLLVILYLIFPLAKGLNVELVQHKINPFYGTYATKRIETAIAKKEVTEEAFSKLFEEKSAKVSKVLLLLFIPYTMLLVYLLYFYKRPFVFDLAILSTEISVFYLSFVFLIFPSVFLLIYKLTGIQLIADETIFTVLPASIFALFCALAFRRFFAENFFISLAKSLVFVVLHLFFLLAIYRFCVFYATMLIA